MHTLTRRALYDNYDLNDLFYKLDSGVDPTDQEMLPAFNRFKAAGGEQWDEIQMHCGAYHEEEDEEDEESD